MLLFALYTHLAKENRVVGWAWHTKAAYAIRWRFPRAAGGLPPAGFSQIPSPRLRGSRRGVHRGLEAQAARATQSKRGENRTQLPVHHSAAISDLAQRAGSPRGPPGAKHNKSWNPPSKEPPDALESCSRTQQCRLFVLWLACFQGAFGWGEVFSGWRRL